MWKWLLLLFGVSFCFFAIQSGDVMMYLTITRDFILEGNWRQTDVFGYLYPQTDGRLIWHHEYLSALLFYGTWALGGFPALIALKSLLLGLMFWLVIREGPREQNARAEWIGLFILAILAASFRFIERASLFSDLFTVLVAAALLRAPVLSKKLIFGLSILFLLWIQLHPGFITGWILIALWAGWREMETRGSIAKNFHWLLLIPLVMLSNPDMHDGLLYPFRFAAVEARTLRLYNFEWMPAYHSAFRFSAEMLAFWLLSFCAAYFFTRAHAWRTLNAIFSVAAFALTLQAVRFVPCAAMIIVLSVKPYAQFSFLKTTRRAFQIPLALFLLAVSIHNIGWGYRSSSGRRLPQLTLDPKFFPTKTIQTLRSLGNAGPIYNSHDLGAYLLWLGIKPIFHHGFVTDMNFYEREVIGAMQTPAQFLELAKKYGWKVLLVDRFGGYRELHRILSPMPEWKIVAEDEASYLIVQFPVK